MNPKRQCHIQTFEVSTDGLYHRRPARRHIGDSSQRWIDARDRSGAIGRPGRKSPERAVGPGV